MVSSDLRNECAFTVNVASFITVKPRVGGDNRSNIFRIWKKQMLCLLQSQDIVGFVDGEIVPPGEDESDEKHKLWRRTDKLVKGWILGSVGTDVLDSLRDKQSARDAWLEMDNIFNKKNQDPRSRDDFSRYLAVYKAALRGDWDTAKNFFGCDINEISTTIISQKSQTALHVAVLTGTSNNDFVNKLLEVIPRDALTIRDCYGQTALYNAAKVGNTAAAYALVNKNPDLLHITSDIEDQLPVHAAATNCQKETLEYLISEHQANRPLLFQSQQGIELFLQLIYSEFVDIALDLAHKYPDLALLRSERNYASALSTIAKVDTLFPMTETFSWCKKFIYHCIPLEKSKHNLTDDFEASNGAVRQKLQSMIWYIIETSVPKVKEMRKMKTKRRQALELAKYLCNQIASQLPEKEATDIFSTSIIDAATYGISEIVEMIIHKFPMVLLYRGGDSGMNIFQLAASCRFENVINLIYSMSDRKYLFFDDRDDELNNILHICGKLAPPHRLNVVAGAALQMQRELQWFKEMENFVHLSRRTWRNEKEQTPQMIFTQEHEELKEEGERWMKDTANACSIAAALIATIMFSAAFTVPGGLNSETGTPVFSHRGAFELFAVSDAISLFTSITSMLMFLSILTSRYAEEDFLYSLPKRLSMGLLSLFVSITFMLVAFSAALYLVLQRDFTWFVILVATFACLPVTSFVLLQFPLLVDVAYSTYGPGIFGNKNDRILY